MNREQRKALVAVIDGFDHDVEGAMVEQLATVAKLLQSSESLQDLMEFDRVVRVLPGRSYTDASELWHPVVPQSSSFIIESDDEGQFLPGAEKRMIDGVLESGWIPFFGYSRAYGVGDSPVMHPSEFIGGTIEQDILDASGYYVSVGVYDSNGQLAGWMVLSWLF